MREKLLRLMQTEGLSSSRFAEMLEAQPSSISHLLSGRNKPSFDLLQKILRRFPRLNPDWLLLDSDQMFRSDSVTGPSKGELFTQVPDTATSNGNSGQPDAFAEFIPTASEQAGVSRPASAGIRQIIVLYEDGTCENYRTRN